MRRALCRFACYAHKGNKPHVDSSAWVAPSATLVGQVRCEAKSSVWFGAVLRGDNSEIVVRPRANVQDNAVVHSDANAPVHIGAGVTVGHLAMLHGCEIGENSLIGIGAVILNHTKIGKNCLVAASTFIGEGKTIPDNSVVMGSPGKVVKQVTDEMAQGFTKNAESYVSKIRDYQDLEKLD